jgi:acyl carrier protein
MKHTIESIQDMIISQLVQHTGIHKDSIDLDQPFSRYGLDSIDSVTLTADIGKWLNLSLPSTILWDYPTIEKLSSYLILLQANLVEKAQNG